MTLLGEHFFGSARVDLDSTRAVQIDEALAVYMGAAQLRASDVKWWSSERVTFTLPQGLSLGMHDLILVTPGKRRAILSNALQVRGLSESGGSGGSVASGGAPGSTGGSVASGGVRSVESPAPRASTFGDYFDDGIIGPEWETLVSAGCSISEAAGGLSFAMDGPACRCGAISRDAFDLRGDQAVFTIDPINDYFPPLFFFIELVFPNGERLQAGFSDNLFAVRLPTSRQLPTPSPVAYQPAPAYWRFVEENGVLSFESSPDAQTWRSDFNLGTGWSLERVRIGVGTDVSADMQGSVGIGVSAYNRP